MRIWIIAMCLAAILVGCSGTPVESESQSENGVRRDVLYFCNCGPECDCNTLSTSEGNCACDQPLKYGHVVKIEGTETLLCQCSDGCECEGLNPDDPALCACGSEIKRVDLAGTGLYFCNCGGSCFCNTVSEEPGKCECGMDLIKG